MSVLQKGFSHSLTADMKQRLLGKGKLLLNILLVFVMMTESCQYKMVFLMRLLIEKKLHSFVL